MHDPLTQIWSYGPFALWHEDPCKDGTDDSCGWFMRARHGKPEVLKAIQNRISFDFDRVSKHYADWNLSDKEAEEKGIAPQRVYHCGLFCPNGDPHLSVSAIVLNMFYAGAWCYFHDKHRGNTAKAWSKSREWMQANLFEILHFAENPTDSLHDGITGKFRIACGEAWNRDEALSGYANCIYGWILRKNRPWWRHPRWHVHHWRPRVYWWWFVPVALQRKLRPEHFGSNAVAKVA